MRAVCRVGLALGLVIVLAGPVVAQGGPHLVNNNSVQQELKLSREQIRKADDVLREAHEKHRAEFNEVQETEDMQERYRKMRAINQIVYAEAYKAFEDVLKPGQLKRLKQIDLQQRGAQAFTDEHVQKELKLTDEQKEKIKTANEDARKEMEQLQQSNVNFQSPEVLKKFAKLRKDALDKITTVLTDDQRKTWKDMTGPHFKIKIEFGRSQGKK